MGDTNYIAAIVRVLESPRQKIFSKNIPRVQFRVQLPQYRRTRIVTLTFWGKLANTVKSYYKINDYILIEGYVSVKIKKKLTLKSKKSTKPEITVFKNLSFYIKQESWKK